MEIVIATTNSGKFAEISAFLRKELPFVDFLSLKDFAYYPLIEEDGSSVEENALKKAKGYAKFFNLPVVAEDSALEVKVLGNAPGVFSSRYGRDDRERVERLLLELSSIPPEEREAQFRCVAYFYLPDGRGFSSTGIARGFITETPEGTGGFGYDPVFYSTELGKRFSEVTPEEKLSVSHRGKALKGLVRFIKLYVLEEELKKVRKIAVAFSGGADSLFLLAVAKKVVEDVIAVFVDNTFFTEEQKIAVNVLTKKLSVKLKQFKMDEDDVNKIRNNDGKRCYYCKNAMFKLLSEWCSKNSYLLIEGTNASDLSVERLGLAAVREYGVRSPLLEVLLEKDEVNKLLSDFFPEVAANTYSDACLLTRFPAGYTPDMDAVRTVVFSEAYLKLIGFNTVRVRMHPDRLCRIEIGKDEIEALLNRNVRKDIAKELKRNGCSFVAVDLEGYRG